MTLEELQKVVISRRELELAMTNKFVQAVGMLRIRTGLELLEAVAALKLQLGDIYLKELWTQRHK